MNRIPRIWVLLGHRKGDNNQALALAEALGLPFETRSVRYNPLHVVSGRLLGRSRASLTSESQGRIGPPWPDVIIAIGRRSVPVARWIQGANKGRTKIVRIGHPRMDPSHFDLVITTRQYPVPAGENVVLLPLAMSRYRNSPKPTQAEQDLLASVPRPHLLMAVGGATKYWQMPDQSILAALERLIARASSQDGSLLIVGSQRTPKRLMRKLAQAAATEQRTHLIPSSRVRFPVLLDDAEEIFVTGDSVSMLSEAVLTGKPAGLIPIEQSLRGRLMLGRETGPNRFRDLRRFWTHLEAQGLIGTLDAPTCAKTDDPAATAAAAVCRLLADSFEPAPAAVAVDQLQ